ncbi:MAG: pyruvate kinase [Syntrophotaleaceae bacterium]
MYDTDPDMIEITTLAEKVAGLKVAAESLEQEAGSFFEVAPGYQASKANLLHYLALRRQDLRSIQEKLARCGLSSLGRAEPHVLASLEAVLRNLHALAGYPASSNTSGISFEEGASLLDCHTDTLLGPKPGHRRVRIMVTVPSEAAENYLLVRDLVANGMDCMRINCSHNDPEVWERMIVNLRRAKRELGKKCHVLMDLAGPKLRTGPVESGARVVKIRPIRDQFGRVAAPARIWLTRGRETDLPDAPADAVLPVPSRWLTGIRQGDTVTFSDARGKKRDIRITSRDSKGCWGELEDTTYIVPGTEVFRIRPSAKEKEPKKGRVGEIADPDPHILLKNGDFLILTRTMVAGHSARYDEKGRMQSPASIGCTLPEVFSSVKAGERIWFDDGKIGGIIRAVSEDQIRVEIVQARSKGEKLRGEKGINLPDTRLAVSALTPKDRNDLEFIVRNAHMVGMSFAQEVADVRQLQELLSELGAPLLGIVLKIETRRGFEMLPDLILAAMRSEAAGVMIARGDLAVECGYQRLAEVQEEILWLCEAAHMPVIWATQVLESLAKNGIPSRAEITDAAMSERAECVMLNKGPFILEAMRVLGNILERMEDHQHKKISKLRQLRWWQRAYTRQAASAEPQSGALFAGVISPMHVFFK